ncbi:hypothetical protein B0G81_7567 [Paraburkholderia sp. BL6665CI2N2]|nr:hypothetical protein B0G73_12961 [Paraburkholderia sp. BL25I1N1]TDY27033.1 hypothetical protein B0G81_7567 [Paraburkholderia sp. BL6665CI2N2]
MAGVARSSETTVMNDVDNPKMRVYIYEQYSHISIQDSR